MGRCPPGMRGCCDYFDELRTYLKNVNRRWDIPTFDISGRGGVVLILFRAIPLIATLCGLAYCGLSLFGILRFYSRRKTLQSRGFTPSVSILKPLCGLDPHAYESLRSHCVQDYPDYEIVFGISDPTDPIVPVVERLIAEFPLIPMKLVVCSSVLGMNFKVSNLLQMVPSARHDFLLINDSDISVPPDYLRRVIGPLGEESVGVVTCLYRGIPAASLGSRLESATISDFMGGVLCANLLERGIHFAMGSTMAFHRRILDAIGGLRSIADHLADDYELGSRTSKAGFRIELADCVVDHYLPRYTPSGFFQHQLRWGRTIRSCRPGGFASLIFTFVFPWSILTFNPLLIAGALLSRLGTAAVLGSLILGNRRVWRECLLLPVRDAIAPVLWLSSYAGSSVVWRGNRFELANGKLRSA